MVDPGENTIEVVAWQQRQSGRLGPGAKIT
jgi:hypothetical protein